MPLTGPPYRSRRAHRRRGRRPGVWLLAAIVALLTSGALYQTVRVRLERSRFPPPGQLVDIGGRRLHVLCIGQGSPTVILESSVLGTSGSGREVREAVSRHTRVCSYDRAGLGWSDPGADEMSAGDFVDDLERLLTTATIDPPYVLVPASAGGLVAELFARRHRDQVVGMVWLDAADSVVLERVAVGLQSTVISIETPACLARVGARLGLLRVFDPLNLDDGSDDGPRTVALTYRVEPMTALCAQVRGLPRSVEEFAAAPALAPDLPMTVLTASSFRRMLPDAFLSRVQALAPQWRAHQERLSRRSTRGRWEVVEGSDHLLTSSAPDVVSAAIVDLLNALHPQ